MMRRRAFMMANGVNPIVIIGSASTSVATSITLPAGVLENDVVVVMSGRNDSAPCSTPTGYTSRKTESTGTLTSKMSTKVMGVSPDSTVAGLDLNGVHLAVVLRNVDTSSPLDTSVLSNTGKFDPANPSAITTTTNAAFLLIGALINHDAAITAPTGYTTAVSSLTDGAEPFIILAYYPVAVDIGTHDPGAFSDAGNLDHVTYTAAFRRA